MWKCEVLFHLTSVEGSEATDRPTRCFFFSLLNGVWSDVTRVVVFLT